MMQHRLSAVLLAAGLASAPAQDLPKALQDGRFTWKASGPLVDVGPGREAADPLVSIKDPSVVFYHGRWHVFATVRMKSGKVDLEYLRTPNGPPTSATANSSAPAWMNGWKWTQPPCASSSRARATRNTGAALTAPSRGGWECSNWSRDAATAGPVR